MMWFSKVTGQLLNLQAERIHYYHLFLFCFIYTTKYW